MIIPMGAIKYSCPIRLILTYILPKIKRKLLYSFHSDSFKIERLVCVETDRRTRLDRLVL